MEVVVRVPDEVRELRAQLEGLRVRLERGERDLLQVCGALERADPTQVECEGP